MRDFEGELRFESKNLRMKFTKRNRRTKSKRERGIEVESDVDFFRFSEMSVMDAVLAGLAGTDVVRPRCRMLQPIDDVPDTILVRRVAGEQIKRGEQNVKSESHFNSADDTTRLPDWQLASVQWPLAILRKMTNGQ